MVILLTILSWFPGEPVALGAENLFETASVAYKQGPGRALFIQQDGLEEAGSLVGGRLRDLSLNVVPEVDTRDGNRGEHTLSLETSLSLANLPRLERELLGAEQQSLVQVAGSERLRFILEVQQAYAQAFLAEILLHHVQELHQQALDQEHNLEDQVARQLAGKADWYAQQALTGEYANEISEMEHRSQAARADLERLLGGPVTLSFPQDPEHLPVDAANPFEPLLNESTTLPEVLISQAQARVARRQAALAEGSNAPQLAPNLHYRDEPDGNRWLGLGVKLSFSLRPRKDATWRKHQAEATSWAARAQWQAASIKAELAGRVGSYERNKDRAVSFQAQVLEPLRRQADLYDEAVLGGHAPRRFQLQAWSQLHEAEHQYILLIHQLWSDRAEARILETISTKGASL